MTFRLAAGPELLHALDHEHCVVFAVDRHFGIQFVNEAWEQFSRNNGGVGSFNAIGGSLWSAVPEVLLPFYREAFGAVLASGDPWNHIYECSSPTELRWYRMRVAASHDGSHLIIANDLLRDAPAPTEAAGELYVTAQGVVVQCAHCRRCRRADGEVWDWVQRYVASPDPRVSHSLCAPCLAYHYPE